ncbi:MAG: hypothetical protein KC910_13495 [Candidatus Eremiobacteraeota bacterium]|nr:hypothetical protein [Candidatus Eremiobacteraeota bacterium]
MGETRGRQVRGIALVSVLIMLSLLLMMVLALFVSSRGGLFSSLNNLRRTEALYVAEAGLAETMEALEASNFVTPSTPLSGTLAAGGSWTVRFKSGPPFSDRDSVNNLANPLGAAESYRGADSVPPSAALIVVEARVGGVERVLEAIIVRGTSTVNAANAIQAGGTLAMSGFVLVDGIKSFEDNTPVPGSIQSNAGTGAAISWDGSGTAKITGSASSVAGGSGAIDLGSYTPDGGKNPGSGVASFPVVDITGTVASKSASPALSVPPLGSANLTAGEYYHSGDVVVNGDLVLNGSDLYIDGGLTVNGSISGEGTIHVTGPTSLQGNSSVVARPDQQVALFSGGDVSLTGFNGTQYLNNLAAIDAPAANYLSNARQTMIDMVGSLDDPTSNLFPYSEVDAQRRTLGLDTTLAYTYAGRPADCTGQLALRIEARDSVPGPSRDFVLKKLDDLSAAYNQGQPYANTMDGFFASYVAPATQDSVVADYLAYGYTDALVDGINDTSSVALGPQLQTIINLIGFDNLGTSYFRGLVYSDGSILAQNDVTVVGGLLAKGDIRLENGTRVTYVEDMYSSAVSVASKNVTVESWIGR